MLPSLATKVLALTTILFCALFILFVILFATKSDKSTAVLTSFVATGSKDDNLNELKKMFKDAKYKVKSADIQSASGSNAWKGLVLIKGDQKISTVSSKVKDQKSSKIDVKSLQMADGSGAASVCNAHAPPVTTTTTTTTTAPQTQPTGPSATTWCPAAGGRDFIYIFDIAWPNVGDNVKKDVYGRMVKTIVAKRPAGARLAFIALDTSNVTVVTNITGASGDLVLASSAISELASQVPKPTNLDSPLPLKEAYDAVVAQTGFMDPYRAVSVILIADHRPDGASKSFKDLMNKYHVAGTFQTIVAKIYNDFVTAGSAFSYGSLPCIESQAEALTCTVNPLPKTSLQHFSACEAEVAAVSGVSAVKMHPLLELLSSQNVETEAQVRKVEYPEAAKCNGVFAETGNGSLQCLSQDIIFVFDETESIHKNTLFDWRDLAKQFIDSFDMQSQNEEYYTRFGVVGFSQYNPGIIQLYEFNEPQALKEQMDAIIKVQNGLTNITSALATVGKMFDDAKIPNRPAHRVVVTMTDAALTNDNRSVAIQAALDLKKNYQADMWFVLAYENMADKTAFPDEYGLAVAMAADDPRRVFNSTCVARQAKDDGHWNIVDNWNDVYPCPAKRCKIVYFMCENSEILDTELNSQSNKLCVENTLKLAEDIYAKDNTTTFRMILYSTIENIRVFPDQGANDTYINFVAEMNRLITGKDTLSDLMGGFVYLGAALEQVPLLHKYYHDLDHLVDGALLIMGQFESDKIDDKPDDLRTAIQHVQEVLGKNIYVVDRTDSQFQAESEKNWQRLTNDAEKIGKAFDADYAKFRSVVDGIGYTAAVSKLDCSLPPIVPCNKMLDIQLIVHFEDDELLEEQISMATALVSNLNAPYPIHLGLIDVDNYDLKMSIPLGVKDSKSIAHALNVSTQADIADQSLHLVKPFITDLQKTSMGCGHLSDNGDRAFVDNIIVVISNDYRKWNINAYQEVEDLMSSWKCADCANYPKFIFVDLASKDTPADKYPTDVKPVRINKYDLTIREPVNLLNSAIQNICNQEITRDCCVLPTSDTHPDGCSQFDPQKACPARTPRQQFEEIIY